MRRTFSIACLFLAWICANGAILDVVQVFAWTKMFAGYALELPVGRALQATFDSSKPCEICLAVAKAKAAEQRQAPQQVERSRERLLLAVDAPVRVYFFHPECEWPATKSELTPPRIEPVPVPPPKDRLA